MSSYSDATQLTGFAGDFEAKIWWQRPNQSRVEAKMGAKTGFGLNDGTTLWALNSEHPGHYIKRAGDKDRIFDALHEANIGAPGFMLNPGDGREDVMKEFVRDGLIKLEMGLPDEFEGAPMQTVRAHFAFNDGRDSLLTFFIGKNDGLLHQLTQTYGGMGTIIETHREIEVNPILPAETWKWTPPAGLEPIEYFSKLEPDRFKPLYKPGQILPNFKAFDLAGKPLSLLALEGKAVILHFFSIQNGQGAVELMELQKQFDPQKLAIIGVSMDGRRERVAEWAKQNGITFPIAFDEKGPENAIATRYGVRSWATTLVIDAEGVLRSVDLRQYEPGFDALLREILP